MRGTSPNYAFLSMLAIPTTTPFAHPTRRRPGRCLKQAFGVLIVASF